MTITTIILSVSLVFFIILFFVAVNDNDRAYLQVKAYEKLLTEIKEKSREPIIKLLARKRFK